MSKVASRMATATKSFRGLAAARLHVMMRSSERFYENYYKTQFGLSLRECRIIGVVGQYRQVSFKRTCDEAYLDKSHVSRLVTVLIRRGVLKKVSDPVDGRSVHLSLTQRGREMHDSLHSAASRLNAHWLSALTVAQRRSFEECLGILSERLTGMIKDNVGSTGRPTGAGQANSGARADDAGSADSSEVILNSDVARQLYRLLGAALGEEAAQTSDSDSRPESVRKGRR